MLFVFSNRPHSRKHGPVGYADYTNYKPWLRDDFQFRCVYCLERERWYPNGHAAFGVDHVLPKSDSAHAALICHYPNLVYACNRCNSVKQNRILLDPCTAAFGEHVSVNAEGMISGSTIDGDRLIYTLGLNRRTATRERYIKILRLSQEFPDHAEVQALYRDYFGYPDDLPDLDSLRPESNSRQDGLAEAYFRQRTEGRLAETYF